METDFKMKDLEISVLKFGSSTVTTLQNVVVVSYGTTLTCG